LIKGRKRSRAIGSHHENPIPEPTKIIRRSPHKKTLLAREGQSKGMKEKIVVIGNENDRSNNRAIEKKIK
jgi:hypothetical protein